MTEKTPEEELANVYKFPPSSNSNFTDQSMPTRKIIRWLKIGVAIFLLTIVILVASALLTGQRISKFFSPKPAPSHFDLSKTVLVDKEQSTIIFIDPHTSTSYLEISSPYHFISRTDEPSKKCEFSEYSAASSKISNMKPSENDHISRQSCFGFDNNVQVAIYEKEAFKGSDCLYVHWHSNQPRLPLETCFDISSSNWYGGGELSEHRWPLNRVHVPLQPFITRAFNKSEASFHTHFVSFLEPYFLSAHGVAILLDDNDHLFMSINENQNKKICFRSAFDKPYDGVIKSPHHDVDIKYMVCHDHSARAIHTQLLEAGHVLHPKTAPISDVLQKPVWSTRGQDISNERSLLSYVNSIKQNGMNFSQLYIDGNYSKSKGNFYFDEKKFPHSAQLIMELDEKLPHKKLKVGIEVFPYIPNFALDKNFHIKKTSSHSSNSHDGPWVLDLYNEEAVDWYVSYLKDIKSQVHVQAFRFSGGDTFSYIRNGFTGPAKMDNFSSFNDITQRYSLIASQFKESSFIGSGYKSQIHGLVADAGPFISSWDHTKGLKSIIPTVLTLGLLGFTFVNVGPVGGIVDVHPDHSILPTRNLYIRWLQLSIFLPVVEFSVGPWEYDINVVNYTKSLLEYRQKVLWPRYLSSAVAEAADVGTPVIRPLWWIAPDDPLAQFIDCEFLLGNDLLVAPVLFQDLMYRDVYLPKGGWWQDMLHGKLYEGGQWLSSFPVGQFEIATFTHKAPPKSKS